MSTAVAATKFSARHGVIDVAALHMWTTVTGRGWDAGVGARRPQAKLSTANHTVAGLCCVAVLR